MASVYKLSFPNGKSYFGLTRLDDPSRRVREHLYAAKSGSTLPVHCAIRKFKCFEVSVLDSDLTLQEAQRLEVQVIRNFKDTAYNLTIGGDGRCGVAHSQETRAKMSAAQKARAADPAWLDRLRVLALGRKQSQEAKEAISKARRGRSTLQKIYRKPVLCELTGIIYDSIQSAAKEIQGSASKISQAANHGSTYRQSKWHFVTQETAR